MRDPAAEQIRKTFKKDEGLYESWKSKLIKILKNGQTRAEVVKLIEPKYKKEKWIDEDQKVESGGEAFRLDDQWVLLCNFTSDNLLAAWGLSPAVRSVEVEPGKDFTGTWVTYFVNGQKYSESNYKNGKLSGEKITYGSSGNKIRVLNYSEGLVNGKETGYDFDKKITYEGQYSSGKKVGNWRIYYKDGSLRSTFNFADDHLDGEYLEYYPKGDAGHTNFKVGNKWFKSNKKSQLKNSSKYLKGKLNGEVLDYYASGNLQQKSEYKDAIPEGVWTWYSDNKESRAFNLDMKPILVTGDILYYQKYLLTTGGKS